MHDDSNLDSTNEAANLAFKVFCAFGANAIAACLWVSFTGNVNRNPGLGLKSLSALFDWIVVFGPPVLLLLTCVASVIALAQGKKKLAARLVVLPVGSVFVLLFLYIAWAAAHS